MQNGTLLPKTAKLSSSSLILAVAIHCLLIGGLWMGVNWQPKPEQEVAAEVWDIKVREAAPLAAGEMAADSGSPDAAPTPENINTDNPADYADGQAVSHERRASADAVSHGRPDIALSQERKQTGNSSRQQSQQNDASRIRNLQSLLLAEAGRVAGGRGYGGGKGAGLGGGSASGTGGGGSAYGLTGTGGTGTNAYATGRADGAYIRRVAAKIKSNTIYNVSGISGNPAVVYDVELYPDGSVRSVRKRSSSGTAGFDEAVRQAVYRSAPYPRDSSGRVPSSFVLTHRPKG